MSEYIWNRLVCCLDVTLNQGFCLFCLHLKCQYMYRKRGGLRGGSCAQGVIILFFLMYCAHLPQETDFCFLLKRSASFCIKTMS